MKFAELINLWEALNAAAEHDELGLNKPQLIDGRTYVSPLALLRNHVRRLLLNALVAIGDKPLIHNGRMLRWRYTHNDFELVPYEFAESVDVPAPGEEKA